MFPIGQYLPETKPGVRILCDDADLGRHVERPWFRAYAAERLGVTLHGGGAAPSGPAEVNTPDLVRHTCVCGASGSGKTRLALLMLAEQLKAGCSVVMLDPKAQTIDHMLQLALAAGIPAGDVTVLRPDLLGSGAPRWNPLSGTGGVPPEQAAANLVSVLARSAPGSWGPRLQDLLTNALIVIAAHRLSLFELARFLQRDDYREGLLRQPPMRGILADPEAYAEAAHFFSHEFSRWAASERTSAVAPVINKFRELLRSPFLRAVLCARRTTLDFASLWQRRGLVLVHLDTAGLGDEGVRLLGGMIAHQLYQMALRSSGTVSVVLCLDEMGVAEGFIGDAATEILAMARSHNLRLLVACQHLAQLSDGLRAALLGNTAVRAFFRLGYDDARLVSSWLSAGTGERLDAIRADLPASSRMNDADAWVERPHVICDGYGTALELTGPAWTAFADFSQNVGGDRQIAGLLQLGAVSGTGRLYVRTPVTGHPVELTRYVRGLSADEYWITGPAPVKLMISFPRPKLAVASRQTETERGQRWLRTLLELPVQQAVLRLSTGTAGIVQVSSLPDLAFSTRFSEYRSRVARCGQTAAEVEATLEWRKSEIERIASLAPPPATTAGAEKRRASGSGTDPSARRPAPAASSPPAPAKRETPPPQPLTKKGATLGSTTTDQPVRRNPPSVSRDPVGKDGSLE